MIWEIVAKPAMIKADVIDEVSRVLQIPSQEAEAMVEALLQGIVQALREGYKVEIRGFGSFGTRRRPGYMGRNPHTAEALEVPPKTIPFFKPSKKLLELLNSKEPAAGETSEQKRPERPKRETDRPGQTAQRAESGTE